jgi:hypothetical protein
MSSSVIVQKLWNYCNVLRDDLSACEHAQAGGMSYLLACTHRQARRQGSEQLTYLLFLLPAHYMQAGRWQTSGRIGWLERFGRQAK